MITLYKSQHIMQILTKAGFNRWGPWAAVVVGGPMQNIKSKKLDDETSQAAR